MSSIRSKRVLAGIAAFLVLAACSPDQLLGPDAEQGIEGIALLGSRCPVQSLENPCPDTPYEAWLVVRKTSGQSVTRVRTGVDGRFRIGLRAGSYVLDPESGTPFPAASQMNVEVEAGVYTEVTVNFDTGIR